MDYEVKNYRVTARTNNLQLELIHPSSFVGLRVKINQRDDNSFDLYYNHSKLLQWLPFTKHNHMQPIFNTIELNPTAVTINDEVIMGGLHIDEHVQYFIIMKM